MHAHLAIRCYYYFFYNEHGRKCLAVVLVTMLEQELSDFVAYWNSHRIRCNRGIECPSGIPEDMFDMPEEFGKRIKYECM